MSPTDQALGVELLRASRDGNVNEVRRLLFRGADPGFADGDGNTAAHFAANRKVLDALIEAARLPDYLYHLEDHLEFNNIYPPAECWTYTHSTFAHLGDIPLSIQGIPVIIPVRKQDPEQNQDTPGTPSSPPSDPYPELIEPTAHITDEIIQKIFETYKEALGFYLLINGYLQIIVPDEFGSTGAASRQPRQFGGLEVSYITQFSTPTANRQTPSGSGTASAPVSLQAAIGRTISAAHKEKPGTKHQASIGVMTKTESDNARYLTIPTHLVTSAWMEHQRPGGVKQLFRSSQPLPPDQSWLNDVQIFSNTEDQLGKVAETFDPTPDSFPGGYSCDISLVDVTNQSEDLFSNIKAPLPIEWLPDARWKIIKHKAKELFLLNHDPASGSYAKSIGLQESEFQPVGEAIFKRQARDKKTEKLSWTGFVSRALLFRTEDRNIQSGTAVCVRDKEIDGTECARVAGFVAFAQEAVKPAPFDMKDPMIHQLLRRGRVAFYGAFEVPSKLREHIIL